MQKFIQKKVLYQKLGSKWYAFTESQNGEILYLPLDENFKNSNYQFVEIIFEKDKSQENEKTKKQKRNIPAEKIY